MPANLDQATIISATKLAARWNCHYSTINRRVGDGVIIPIARAGQQMTFAMQDILRYEAGRLPKQRKLARLSQGEQAALPGVLALMGLDQAELTQSECKSILAIFYSVPYEHRKDVSAMAVYFELGLLLLKAMGRAETRDTIKASPMLQGMVKDLLSAVVNIYPEACVT